MTLGQYLDELADSHQAIRAAKLTSLSQLTSDERAEFTRRWASIDLDRRVQIVQQLTEIAEDNPEYDFHAVLLECLADRDPRVRAAAVDGLWEYEGRDLILILIERLEADEDASVRAAAALALGRFVVLGEFGALRSTDLQTIEDALTHAINDGTEFEEVRARALEALGARSEAWVRELIEDAYSSDDHRMQVAAMHAMGRSCDADWLPAVIQQLQSDDAELRYEAATAAGTIGDEGAVPHLAFLIDDEDSEVQEMAIEALGEIGGTEARAVLARHMNHPDERVREVVREALSSMQLGGTLDGDEADDV